MRLLRMWFGSDDGSSGLILGLGDLEVLFHSCDRSRDILKAEWGPHTTNTGHRFAGCFESCPVGLQCHPCSAGIPEGRSSLVRVQL